MDGLKNYREKIKSIEELVIKMENGELSIHELVELESLTRDVHERSIILKYKAFEAVGTLKAETDEVGEIIEDAAESVEEVSVKMEAEEDESKPEPQGMPEVDFSLFDEPSEPEEKPEIKPPHQITLTQSDLVEEKIEQPAPVVEKTPEPIVVPTPEPVAKEEPKEEVKAESKPELVAEDPIVVVKEKGSSFLDRLSILDNSIGSQIAGRKLDTLTGAFGINERLLYINELFDGSGDAFSDAVKALDSQKDLDAASAKVEELAFQNSWNPEEETVLEFLAIIKRRYA